MLLPECFRFSRPTLIVAADRMQARLFLARENSLDELTAFHSSGFPLDDKEKYSIQVFDGVHAGGEDESIRERVGRSFFRDLSRYLHELRQRKIFDEVVLLMPHEYRNSLLATLAPDVRTRLKRIIAKEIIHEPPLKIVARVWQDR